MMKERLKTGLKGLGNRALFLLFPRAANCLCCGDPRRAGWEDCLCDDCRRELAESHVPSQACNRCLSPVEKGKKCKFCASPYMKHIQEVYAPYRYGGAVRQLIHAFKFNACDEALPLLADAMAGALTKRDFDCIVPVPLHPRRLRQRGVNQALLLARELTERTGIPTRELLIRTHYHKPQSLLPFAQRRKNVEKAFVCPDGAKGLRILLLDDVRTSGSTARSCAQALKKNEAQSVSLCTAAVVHRGKRGKSA